MRAGWRPVGLLLAVVAGWLLVGPQHLGGPVTAVSTHGDSMLPTLEPHHLVLVRRSPTYEVGDIVAYRSATLDAVVLHRIVDGDASSGFVTQGDNNHWLDPDTPTADQLMGHAWVAVPEAGRLLELPVALRAAPILLAMTGATMTSRRTPRTQRRRGRPDARVDDRSRPAVPASPPHAVTGAMGVLALAIAGAAVAWSSPVRQPGPVDFEQQARLSYAADTDDRAVYPDGSIDTGDAIFLQVRDAVPVAVDWTLATDADASASGQGQLTARVATGSGWHATVPLGPATDWDGTEATLGGTLDFARLQRLAARAGERTGVDASDVTVTVTAEIEATGAVDGVPIEPTLAPTWDFSVSELRAAPVDAGDDDTAAAEPFLVTEPGSVTVPGTSPAQLSVTGRSLAVSTARPGAIALVAVGLALVVAAVLWTRRTRDWDANDRVLARHGDAMVDVSGLSPSGGTSVAVADVDDLAALADSRGLPVLRVPLQAGGYGYVVDDMAVRYYHLIPRPSAPGGDEPDVAAHSSPDAAAVPVAQRDAAPVA